MKFNYNPQVTTYTHNLALQGKDQYILSGQTLSTLLAKITLGTAISSINDTIIPDIYTLAINLTFTNSNYGTIEAKTGIDLVGRSYYQLLTYNKITEIPVEVFV